MHTTSHRPSLVHAALGGLVLLATLAALSAGPPPASASIYGDIPYIDAVGAWTTAQSLRRLLPDAHGVGRATTGKARRHSGRRGRRRPTKRQIAKLGFDRDRRVTRRNIDGMVRRLDLPVDPALLAADINRVRREMHRELRGWRGRWSPNDLADTLTFALVTSYAAYYNRRDIPDRGIARVRRALRDYLAGRRAIRRSPDRRKQRFAEKVELRLIYVLSAINQARDAGDGDAVEEARWEIRGWLNKAFGVDLERTRITRKGLVRR